MSYVTMRMRQMPAVRGFRGVRGLANVEPMGPTPVTPQLSPIWRVTMGLAAGASAYHGYRRNQSVGWAIWWGFMGGLFPIVTVPIALAQGFGKKG